MRRYFKFIVPLSFVLLLLLSACELSRSDDSGDLSGTQPPAVDTSEPQPGQTDVPDPGERPADISEEPYIVPEAPSAEITERGKVLVKLSPEASIQAFSVELDDEGVVSAGVPGLDQTLQDIGASELEPLLRSVAEIKGANVETFSIQSEEVGQLFAVNYTSGQEPTEVAEMLSQDPTVEYAEPNYYAGMVGGPDDALTPNDPYFKFQWNFNKIQVPAAWDRTTGNGIVVAIIDTGIDFNTPDLVNAKKMPGYNFVDSIADATDDQGHGTHVAGTVAQNTNNGQGVAGVAFNATLLPIKTLGADGQGSYEGIIQGIVFAVDQGADVINMSLAGRSDSQALRDAVRYAHGRGVVVVAAAGNSNSAVQFPAAYDDFVIAVGATGFNDTRAPYSNFGPQIDIVAPGGDVQADLNGDGYGDGILQNTIRSTGEGYSYRFFQGTSMASPHVAGVAALMRSVAPEASPDQIKGAIQQTALNLGPADQFGAGLIQADSALQAIQPDVPVTITPTPLPDITLTPTPIPPQPTFTPTPIVVEDPTDTPTPLPPPITSTPTPIPPPPPGSANELVTNGGFETDTGWTFGDTPIQGTYDTAVALSGARSAKLGAVQGGDRLSYSSVWQKVSIPAQARQAMLTVNIYPITQDSWGDFQYIMVLDQNRRVIRTLRRELSNSQTWETHSFDLSDLRGQTIYIYFGVYNRGSTGRLTAMYLDNVSLQWAP